MKSIYNSSVVESLNQSDAHGYTVGGHYYIGGNIKYSWAEILDRDEVVIEFYEMGIGMGLGADVNVQVPDASPSKAQLMGREMDKEDSIKRAREMVENNNSQAAEAYLKKQHEK